MPCQGAIRKRRRLSHKRLFAPRFAPGDIYASVRKAPRIALAFGDFASLRGIRSLDLVRSGLRFSFKTTCRIQPAMPRLRPLVAGNTSFTPANLHCLTRDTFLTFAISLMRLLHATSTWSEDGEAIWQSLKSRCVAAWQRREGRTRASGGTRQYVHSQSLSMKLESRPTCLTVV